MASTVVGVVHVEVLELFPTVEPAPTPEPAAVDDPPVLGEPEPRVEIRTSNRRRKTISAYWEGDDIVVVVPPRMSKREQQAYADELVPKLLASRARTRPTDEQLTTRAAALSRRYLGGKAKPASVTWSSRQRHQWGSCSMGDRTIRISDRLKGVPPWVLDTVLVHELAHLLHAEHSPEFHALANRHPRMADAEVFLEGYALGLSRRS